jgi:patatin-like phospholipase/acyl hydrolase
MYYDTLYLTPGGTHGYSILGAVSVLEQVGLIKNLKKIIGISIGSLISLLLILKFSTSEIFKVFLSHDIEDIYFNSQLNNTNLILNLINNLGINNGNGISRLLQLFLVSRKLDINLTFKDLYEYNNIELIIIASNITTGKLHYFSHKLTPDCSVLVGIKASCAIPIIFNPISYENNLLIDGGFFDVDSNTLVDNKTLTIRLLTDRNNYLDLQDINILQYFKVLFDCINKFEHNDEKSHTIKLIFKTDGINFNISDEDKRVMFNYGVSETLKFVKYKRQLKYIFDIWKDIKQ